MGKSASELSLDGDGPDGLWGVTGLQHGSMMTGSTEVHLVLKN